MAQRAMLLAVVAATFGGFVVWNGLPATLFASNVAPTLRLRVFLVGDAGKKTFEQLVACRAIEEAIRQPALALEVLESTDSQRNAIIEEAVARITLAPDDNTLESVARLCAPPNPALTWLKRDLANASDSLVVYLGDNLYPKGLDPLPSGPITDSAPWRERLRGEAILLMQAKAAASARRGVVFIPGNHDWNRRLNGSPDGERRLREQAAALAEIKRNTGIDVRLLPELACAGPTVAAVTEGLLVLAIDSQWLLEKRPPQEGCFADTCEQAGDCFKAQMERILRSHQGNDLLVLTHHPMRTYGAHAGRRWLSWLGICHQQDMCGGRNEKMRALVETAVSIVPSAKLFFAAGHDHSLQLMDTTGGPVFMVSGAGSALTKVGRGQDTRHSSSRNGYMVLEFFDDGRVLCQVVETDAVVAAGRALPPATRSWYEVRSSGTH